MLLKNEAKEGGNLESNFMPLNDHDLEESNHICMLSKGTDSENAFKFEKVPDSEVKDILFARSALPYITYFISYISKKRIKNLKPSKYKKMEEILRRLCCFVLDKPYRDNINIFEFDTEPIRERQTLMR